MTQRTQQDRLYTAGQVPDPANMRPGQVVINVIDGLAWTTDGLGNLKPLFGGATEPPPDPDPDPDPPTTFGVRGIASVSAQGEYYLQPSDNLITLVFLVPATVVIPDNVTFPSGFRAQVRQSFATTPTDYVYIEAAPAIILNAPQDNEGDGPINGTRDEFSTIELQLVAGGTWTIVAGFEGDHYAQRPSVPAIYVANPGVNTTSGKATGFSNTTVPDGQELTFRAYMKLAPTADPPPPDPGTDPPGAQNFYLGHQFAGKADNNRTQAEAFLNDRGWQEPGISYWHPFYQPDPKPAEGSDTMPTEAKVKAEAAKQVKPYHTIDIEENWSMWTWGAAKDGSNAELREFSGYLRTILDWWKEARPSSNHLVGWYRMMPYSHYNSAASMSQRWVDVTNILAEPGGCAEAMDFHAPRAYTFNRDQNKWADYAVNQCRECKRIAPNAPVLVYLWPHYHQSLDPALIQIEPGFWRFQLDTLLAAPECDGLVIWGGWGEWDPKWPSGGPTWSQLQNEEAWQETVAFGDSLGS